MLSYYITISYELTLVVLLEGAGPLVPNKPLIRVIPRGRRRQRHNHPIAAIDRIKLTKVNNQIKRKALNS
jgi:hypothetical protein